MTVTHSILYRLNIMIFWGQLNLQEGASVVMELINYFHDYIIRILIFILVFVTYLFLFVLLSPYSDKYTTDSHALETIWTIIPMLILLFIAFPSLYLLYLIEDVFKPSLIIKVIGHQWYWEYQYSCSWFNYSFDSYIVHDSSSTPLFYTLDVDNRLVLPTITNILFLVTSADVLHSWTVPSLGIKADATPGRLNYLSTKSLFSGVFFGQCSEICGSNHSFIPIVVEFVPIQHFVSYLSTL